MLILKSPAFLLYCYSACVFFASEFNNVDLASGVLAHSEMLSFYMSLFATLILRPSCYQCDTHFIHMPLEKRAHIKFPSDAFTKQSTKTGESTSHLPSDSEPNNVHVHIVTYWLCVQQRR